MTVRQAERITGCEIVIVEAEKGVDLVALEGETTLARVNCPKPSRMHELLALRTLVQKLYNIRGKQAFERAGGRCEDCGEKALLSRHHELFRSHGRNDRAWNLKGLCVRCHAKAHGVNLRVNIKKGGPASEEHSWNNKGAGPNTRPPGGLSGDNSGH